jgi:pimeloyl-ACP methyl ester carboxylesterase
VAGKAVIRLSPGCGRARISRNGYNPASERPFYFYSGRRGFEPRVPEDPDTETETMTITETSRSEFITLRGSARTCANGEPGAPKLFMLHGWMDVAASFQFLVDAFQRDWHVIAMDWRGFGETDHPTRYPGTASYWFPDYVADLED